MRVSRRTLIKSGTFALIATPLMKIDSFAESLASSNLIEPKQIKSVNGALNVTLDAKPTMLPFMNSKRWALTYNGTFPGPTLVAKPGDVINVTLRNSTHYMTNLHTHGPHVSPSGNSDNPFIMIDPGKSFAYQFRIPKNQEPGTFWYHPHHHQFVAKQLSAGLAGAIIIEGDSDKLLSNTSDRTLLFADPRIGTTSGVMDSSMMDQMHGRVGDYLLINGQIKPTITAKKGVTERWRLINASPSRFLNLSVEGGTFTIIGTDGGRTKPFEVSKLSVTPGQRYEVLVNTTRTGFARIFNDNSVVGYLNGPLNKAKIPALNAVATIPASKVLKTRNIAIEQNGNGMMSMNFTFNGETFDATKINQKVKLNTVEDWVITNTSHMVHPFHIHAWAFQIIDRGDGKPDPGWKDTVAIPVGLKVRIRINFADFGGKSVYHCHILDHEDTGMMGIVEVK